VRLCISDTGPGIAKKYWNKVFEKFVLIENIDEHTRGLGLGLPLSKMIIEAHNGTIELDKPTQKKGVHVRITLPLSDKRTKSKS